MIVIPPIYLAIGKHSCWKCNGTFSVAALIASSVDDPQAEGFVCILSNIESVPDRLLEVIQAKVSSFQLTASRTAGFHYYGNVCPKCGALSGDFYLHNEPGGPFFPTSEREASGVEIAEISLAGSLEIEGSFHVGVGEMLLQHARRIGGIPLPER
jgi:hypothetical protein